MKFRVNGELKEIIAIDKNGNECTKSIVGTDLYREDLGRDVFINDAGEYCLTQEKFEYWSKCVEVLNEVIKRENKMLPEVDKEYENIMFGGNNLLENAKRRLEWIREKERGGKKMKYNSYQQTRIGSSDIASLILAGCGSEDERELRLKELHFGSDGDYKAYICDDDAEIGEHYTQVYNCYSWMKVYDDGLCQETFRAREIKVYRAGDFGCIIQLCNK